VRKDGSLPRRPPNSDESVQNNPSWSLFFATARPGTAVPASYEILRDLGRQGRYGMQSRHSRSDLVRYRWAMVPRLSPILPLPRCTRGYIGGGVRDLISVWRVPPSGYTTGAGSVVPHGPSITGVPGQAKDVTLRHLGSATFPFPVQQSSSHGVPMEHHVGFMLVDVDPRLWMHFKLYILNISF
jgi:hypothetical protein